MRAAHRWWSRSALCLLLGPLSGCLVGYEPRPLAGVEVADPAAPDATVAPPSSEPTDTDTGGGLDNELADAGADGAAWAEDRPPADTGDVVAVGPELWFSVENSLVRVPLTADGRAERFEVHPLVAGIPGGMTSLTVLPDGGLLMARSPLGITATTFYHLPQPPRTDDGTQVSPIVLGEVLGDILVEGVLTTCDGTLYVMDSATDPDAPGSRVLRLTGDVTQGENGTAVARDLGPTAPDFDDMAPNVVNNELVDNPGLVIDTGTLYQLDIPAGEFASVREGLNGGLGVHTLGRQFFADDRARLYVISRVGDLFAVDPVTYESELLLQWPDRSDTFRAFTGLAGSLTPCSSMLP